ncbi:MAG TPA: hypothetical protein VEY30_12125, partial [Myxococcaceae bacterium]|nr:hypothetical protein [Myxococcaceae bacterium]
MFPVRAGERKLTFALFLHSFFAVGFVTAGRSARDALFLSHFGSAQLFWMYLTSAAAVAGVGLAYSPWIRRLRRDRAAQGGA